MSNNNSHPRPEGQPADPAITVLLSQVALLRAQVSALTAVLVVVAERLGISDQAQLIQSLVTDQEKTAANILQQMNEQIARHKAS